MTLHGPVDEISDVVMFYMYAFFQVGLKNMPSIIMWSYMCTCVGFGVEDPDEAAVCRVGENLNAKIIIDFRKSSTSTVRNPATPM